MQDAKKDFLCKNTMARILFKILPKEYVKDMRTKIVNFNKIIPFNGPGVARQLVPFEKFHRIRGANLRLFLMLNMLPLKR